MSMRVNKTLVFDMDGTIADLYGVNGWLEDIIDNNARPYAIAKPLVNMFSLVEILKVFKSIGWKIVVTSWLAKNSNAEYDRKVTNAKIEWLKKYNFPCDEINIVKYGTVKTTCTKKIGGYQILIDDEKPNRDSWNLGDTINSTENLIKSLIDLLLNEIE